MCALPAISVWSTAEQIICLNWFFSGKFETGNLNNMSMDVSPEFVCPRCSDTDFYWSNQQRTRTEGGWIGPFGIHGGQRQVQYTKKIPFCKKCKEQMNRHPDRILEEQLALQPQLDFEEKFRKKVRNLSFIGGAIIAILIALNLIWQQFNPPTLFEKCVDIYISNGFSDFAAESECADKK